VKRFVRTLRAPMQRLSRSMRTAYWSSRVRWAAGAYVGPVTANGPTRVTRNTTLGRNVHFNGLSVMGGGAVSIGDNFHSGRECLIITAVHDYDGGEALPYGEAEIVKPVHIGDNVWLGARVVIIGEVTIGEGAIVQAGAVVVSDVAPCAIVGGNPATAFKTRDVDHYNKLKAEGQC
jgi:acetyltransferase-like isoleucine patch superfamily enzyme